MMMLRTAEIDMAISVAPSDMDTFLTNASWAVCSTYHTVLQASPDAAIFRRDMLFDIPYVADWNKIGDFRQHQTDQIPHVKIRHGSNMITQWAKKY